METIFDLCINNKDKIRVDGYLSTHGEWIMYLNPSQDMDSKQLIFIMEDNIFKYFLRIQDSLQHNMLYRQRKKD